MDGLCRSLAGRVDFHAGRLFCWLRPLFLRDVATLEYVMLARRRNPMEEVEDAFAVMADATGARQALLASAELAMHADRSSRCVKAAELLDWLYSRDGAAWVALLCLEKTPGVPALSDPDDAERLVASWDKDQFAEFVRRFSMISGLDLMSKMDWQDGPGDPPGKYIPWRKIVRGLAEKHHWTLEQAGGITFYQLRLLTVDEKMLGGTQRMNRKEAMSFVAGKRSQRERNILRFDPKDTPARRAARQQLIEMSLSKPKKA